MVDAPGQPHPITDDPEIMGALTGRRHREDDDLRFVRHARVLHETVAERLVVPVRLGPWIGGGDRQVVDAPHADAPRKVALRAVGEARSLVGRRDVALDVPEDLVAMSGRSAIPKRAAVTDRVLLPALADAGLGQAPDRLLELLRSVGPPADVRERHLGPLGELQGVVEAIGPGAEVHRLPDALRLLEAYDLGPEVQRLLRYGRGQLDVGKLRQQAHRRPPRFDGTARSESVFWFGCYRRRRRFAPRPTPGAWCQWRAFHRAIRTKSSGTGAGGREGSNSR